MISIKVGSTFAFLYCSAIILFALGGSTTGTRRCTPKAFLNDPLTSLYFGTFISAKDKMSTKKAISSVAISANVAIQAGAPLLQGGQSGSSAGSGSSGGSISSGGSGGSACSSATTGNGASSTSVAESFSEAIGGFSSSCSAIRPPPALTINN